MSKILIKDCNCPEIELLFPLYDQDEEHFTLQDLQGAFPKATCLRYKDGNESQFHHVLCRDGKFCVPEGGWVREGREYFAVALEESQSRVERFNEFRQSVARNRGHFLNTRRHHQQGSSRVDARRRTKANKQAMEYLCEICGASFTQKGNLSRHIASKHKQERRFVCQWCEKKFTRKHNARQHERICVQNKDNRSSNQDMTIENPQSHKKQSKTQEIHQQPNHASSTPIIPSHIKSPQAGPSCETRGNTNAYRCRRCNESFDNRRTLYHHNMREHAQRGGGFLQPSPYILNKEPWQNDQPLREIYHTNTPFILQRHQEGSVTSTYNIPLTNDFSVNELMEHMQEIYDRQHNAFRLNLQFGLILVNTETGEYRYFIPHSNESLFPRPIYVSRRHDLMKLRKRLERFNVVDYIMQQRPNTKWKPVLVTNVHFSLFHLNYLLGAPLHLPDYITSSKVICALHKDRKNQDYDDNLCAFRCLSTHYHGRVELETNSKRYFQKWMEFINTKDSLIHDTVDDFEGVNLDQMGLFEKCFQINVNIYELQEDGSAKSIYKSMYHFKDTMFLNMYENHLSYISNINAFARKYQCRTCERHFGRVNNMQRHQRICKGRTKYQFPGGFYTAPHTIFDVMESYNIFVPEHEKLFPYFLVYDFEAMLLPVEVEEGDQKLKWSHKHVPISVSICSNVVNFTNPHCIVDSNTETLVASMVAYMNEIASVGFQLMHEKFKDVFELIEDMIENPDNHYTPPIYEDDGDTYKPSDDQLADFVDKINDVKEKFEAYCKQMICLGFNSAKYDMNLVKSHLAKHLKLHENNIFTVKRNNQYTCLANENLKFLDITSYLSPGINYVKFLKAFDVAEEKGFFPYEWFDDETKLDHPSLPPREAFYSSLKDTDISPEDYDLCEKVWKDNHMSTFREFLVWYNNLDVAPFVTAVKNLQKYYFKRNIDIFKVSISVPGLARRMLFECGKDAGASFALFDKENADLYYTIKKNIIGGPSIIFNRHHEAGVTDIRNNPNKPCQKIVGFDANALYLYCIGQPMPTGPFVRRKVEDQFKPLRKEKYMLAYHWLDWLNSKYGLKIQHKLNQGKEKKIFQYPVDGYDEETNTVFQFHGCYWHGHRCWLTKSLQGMEKWERTALKRTKRTKTITNFIQSQGYDVIEMKECEFRTKMRFNAKLKEFLDVRQPPTPQRQMAESEVLQSVVDGKLFGMIEVDIRVPEKWSAYFQHPTMTPHEYFAEMSPIFCTSEVFHDVIGQHMQDYVKKFDLSTKPRRLLIGGMRAQKILLATPLLKWYLEHGLEVTKIYQTVEFKPMRCFQQFVRDISSARRVGDVDSSKTIIADTRKLEGNSAFGSTIMDQEKFQDTIYVKGQGPAMLEANLPQFKKLTQLIEDEEYYEVEKAKTTIKLNLPIQIGYFILQYAKLHMLQFYYDFLDKFVDRSDFEYLEMDTDSAYMALAAPDFLSAVKPEMKDEYLRGLQGHCRHGLDIEADCKDHWFPRTCCQSHNKFDKRTPGLFKIEYEGDVMIGLCSKTYIVAKRVTKSTSNTVICATKLLRKIKKLKIKRLYPKSRTCFETKFSSKGISKKAVRSPLTTFRRVLKTKKPGSATNKGLRARHNTMFTYNQERSGFSYFYCKREVLADGRTTVPLDLELCPSKGEATEFE